LIGDIEHIFVPALEKFSEWDEYIKITAQGCLLTEVEAQLYLNSEYVDGNIK